MAIADYLRDPRNAAPSSAGVGVLPATPPVSPVSTPYDRVASPVPSTVSSRTVDPSTLDRYDPFSSRPGITANPSPADGGASDRPARPSSPAPSQQNWAQLFEEERRAAAIARQNLEIEYADRRRDLRNQYQFAETEEEKAQLAFLMAELDAATQRADQAIVSGYAYAVESIQNLQAGGRTSLGQESQAIQNLFLNAGSQYGGMVGDVQQRVGLQGGLAGNAYDPASDFYSILAADQAREAALSERLGGVVGREMTDAQRRMAFQQASQQADLQRQSTQSGAQTRADQQAAVAARIARERLDFVNQLRQLQSTYAGIGASFDQSAIDSYGEQAQLAMSESMMREQLASQERMSGASISARLREMEAQWAREDAARPAWQTPEMAQALLNWDLLPDSMRTQDAYNRILGPYFGVGNTGAGPAASTTDPYNRPAPSPTPPQSDSDILARAEQIQAQTYYLQQVEYYTNALTSNNAYYSRSPQEIRRQAEQTALAAVRRRYPNFTP